MLGVDLNQYRNLPDYNQLPKDGYEFAIIKLATGMTFTNPLFEKQYNGCKDAGLILGVYTRADKTAGNGAAEAEYALNILGDRDVDLPIYYDVEGETIKASKETLTQMVLDFGKVITEAGRRWGLYTSRSHFQYFDLDTIKAAGASIWCAAYNNVGPGMDCDIWQKSSSGIITGYSGPVDVNILYNEDIIKERSKLSMNLIKMYQKQSTWYKGTTTGVPVGICFHDTGCNNTTLKRYVQPNDDDPNRAEMLAKIGYNPNHNDWNHCRRNAGVNAWIGRLADGTIATVQAGPWNYRPWGVGSGWRGSLNGDKNDPNTPFWLQFEICQDDRKSYPYFESVYFEAIALCAYWCKMFNLDPHGTVHYKGVDVPVITCHQDSYKLGLGANHSDVLDWFPKFGIDMEEVRNDVAVAMGKTVTPEPEPEEPEKPDTPTTPVDGTVKVGSLVSINSGAKYYSGAAIPAWVAKLNWYVYSAPEGKDRIVLNASEDGKYKIMSPIHRSDVTVVGATTKPTTPSNPTTPSTPTTPSEPTGFKVKVLCDALNIRKGPGTNYDIAGVIRDRGIYTIVQTQGTWGKLKSGAGWISLGWCSRL